jgi:cytochrome c
MTRPALLLLLLGAAGCSRTNPHAEAKVLIAERCATCHIVSGVKEATGRIGPPLDHIGRQRIVAGFFENDRTTLVRWILHPQAMLPGNAMPDPGLTPAQAGQIADYLISLDKPS